MLFQQTDKRWIGEIMTGPLDFPNMSYKEKKKRWKNLMPDYIGRWGCFLVSWVNVWNSKNKRQINPKEMCKIFRDNSVFNILHDQECDYGTESCSDMMKIEKTFSVKITDRIQKGNIDISHPNKYWIARVPYNPEKGILSGHYNIITGLQENGDPIHFDSDSGIFREDWKESDDYWIKEIEFI